MTPQVSHRIEDARIRPVRSPEDLERAAAFLKTARVREVAAAHPDERGCVRMCEIDGELVGALLIDPQPLRVRGVDVPCARIHETAGEDGRALFRRTGERALFDFMTEELLGYLWARRYPLAFVHGELALYPQHNFAPCFFHPRVYVDVEAALRLPQPYRVRHLKSDDIRSILTLRERASRWKPVVFATGVPLFHHFCIEAPGRRIRGCFSLEVNAEASWNPRFFAPEADVADRAAACTLLRHCAEKAHAIGLKRMHFPLGAGHPIARLCLELGGESVLKGASADPLLDEELVHVVDPCWVAQSLADYFTQQLDESGVREAAIIIPVATEVGQWAFRVQKGTVELLRLKKRAAECVEMRHWAFVQLLTGYRDAGEIEAAFTARQIEFLRTILPKTWPASMPDSDHWRAVEPPLPYAADVAEQVRELKLPWTAW